MNNPTRLWILAPPNGVVNSSSWPSPIVTGSANGLSNVQIKINNEPYLANTLNSLQEQYMEFKNACGVLGLDSDSGGVISFTDWLKTYRIVCVDLSRYRNKMGDPNAPVSIVVSANLLTTVASDLIYIVEKKRVCTISFGTGQASINLSDLVN